MNAISFDRYHYARVLRLMSPEARAIVDAVSAEWKLPASAIISSSRYPAIVAARSDIMRRMRALGWSYPRIGLEIGRDHSSVQYAVSNAPAMTRRRTMRRKAL
jgi:chromosomal replication initiation ATPase DnaA